MKQALINCNVLDGTANMQLQENMTILLEDGYISAIGQNLDVNGYEVTDLKGKYVMPGLINLHVHLPASGKPSKKKTDPTKLVKFILSNGLTRKLGMNICKASVQTALLSGCTTLRTVGGIDDFDTNIKKDIEAGKYFGPRIKASNYAIGPKGGHMVGSVAVPVEDRVSAVKMVDKIADQGVDWIKLMITGGVLDAKVKGEPGVLKMQPGIVKACCDEAHRLGYRVCAHVESPEGVRVALENGVDSIEHGSKLDQHMIDLFKEHNACYVCTISPALPLAKFNPKYTGANDMVIYNSEFVMQGIISGAKTALENGILVGLGTDTGCPYITHYNLWRELEYFHKYLEVSREFALHTATLRNAQILGMENEIGSLEVGKRGDILVSNTNPLEGFSALSKPYMVIKDEKIFKEPKIKKFAEVDNLLDQYM